jgi:hypothetical protein
VSGGIGDVASQPLQAGVSAAATTLGVSMEKEKIDNNRELRRSKSNAYKSFVLLLTSKIFQRSLSTVTSPRIPLANKMFHLLSHHLTLVLKFKTIAMLKLNPTQAMTRR